ncbi:MAG: prepilin-type N-terminal cleavage/methylation domain-containing protein [Coriobacteriia bacterium]|nr:prepilin-type N-terminal cleavage/methylation domain-containing protein [Coriobacteriia bacterium]
MDNARRTRLHDEGFTLLELTFVVLLISILLLVAVASFRDSSGRAAEAACLSNQRTLSTAITLYRADNDGDAPDSLDDLGSYVRDIEKASVCPFDGITELILGTGLVTCDNH